MRNDFSDFTADFWGDRVRLAGKSYLSGQFVVAALNIKVDDRAFLMMDSRYPDDLHDEIENGFLYKKTFDKVKEAILRSFERMQQIPPFKMLDTDHYEAHRLERMFSESNCELLQRYLLLKGKLSENCFVEPFYRTEVDKQQENLLRDGQYELAELIKTLRFYTTVSSDIVTLTLRARAFVDRLSQMKKFDESHLIAEAYPLYEWHYTQSDINEDRRSVFKAMHADIEYVPMKKAGKKKVYVTARRMHFNRLLDFFIADFFEGIHSGHYPKKCGICGRYFLVPNARNQKYCNGKAPGDPQKRSCRRVAAERGRKERETAQSHPIKHLCITRLNTIRAHVKQGKITEEFAAEAKRLAQDLKDRALHDEKYAAKQYRQDMTQDAIYAAVKQTLGL